MTEFLAKKSVVFWPEDPEESVAEKPIIIELYHDVFQIKQKDSYINLNYESIKEFCKLLRSLEDKRE